MVLSSDLPVCQEDCVARPPISNVPVMVLSQRHDDTECLLQTSIASRKKCGGYSELSEVIALEERIRLLWTP